MSPDLVFFHSMAHTTGPDAAGKSRHHFSLSVVPFFLSFFGVVDDDDDIVLFGLVWLCFVFVFAGGISGRRGRGAGGGGGGGGGGVCVCNFSYARRARSA